MKIRVTKHSSQMAQYYNDRVTPTNPPMLTFDSRLFMKGESMTVTQKRALINNPWDQQLVVGLGSTGLRNIPSLARQDSPKSRFPSRISSE